MKLAKINDVRVGQIWTFNEGQTYDLVIDVRNIDEDFRDCLYEVNYIIYGDLEYNIEHKKEKGDNYFIDAEYCRRDEPASNDILEKFKDMNNLVGFLGITHKIEDGKLVEIQRKKLEKDDIIESRNVKYFVKEITKDCIVLLDCDEDLMRLSYEKKYLKEYLIDYKKIGTLGVNYFFQNSKLNN